MSKTIHINPFFFVGFLIYLLAGAFLLVNYAKGEFELAINQNHSLFADSFFKYFTFVGDGIFYGAVILILFFFNRKNAFMALICFVLVSLTAQILKLFVFYQALRPKVFFGEKINLHFVEGVEIYTQNTFPSGHSATAFSLFCLLALLLSNKRWGLICILFAILAAFSRVYLLQHFFVDTYFGAIIGVLLTLIVYGIFKH